MSDMSANPGQLDLILSDVAHLFSASDPDPFSPGDCEVLGISGFDHLLNRLNMDKSMQRSSTLLLSLPADKASQTDAGPITNALHRQASVRLQEQQRELHNTYRYGWKVAGIALLILALCLAMSHLFASDYTESMRPLMRKTFEYGFEIIGWVIMWHPVDVLVFSPLPIRCRIAALKTLAALKVDVKGF